MSCVRPKEKRIRSSLWSTSGPDSIFTPGHNSPYVHMSSCDLLSYTQRCLSGWIVKSTPWISRTQSRGIRVVFLPSSGTFRKVVELGTLLSAFSPVNLCNLIFCGKTHFVTPYQDIRYKINGPILSWGFHQQSFRVFRALKNASPVFHLILSLCEMNKTFTTLDYNRNDCNTASDLVANCIKSHWTGIFLFVWPCWRRRGA